MTEPVDRRVFIKRTLLGGAALAVAGAIPLALRRTRLIPLPAEALRFFTAREYSIFAAVADRVVQGPLSARELRVTEKTDTLMAAADPDSQRDLRQLLALFDSALAAFLFDGRITPFTALAPAAQDEALRQWRDSRLALRRSGLQAMQRLSLAMAYSDPRTYEGIGYPGPPTLLRPDGSRVGAAP
jgi:hypothetical protein